MSYPTLFKIDRSLFIFAFAVATSGIAAAEESKSSAETKVLTSKELTSAKASHPLQRVIDLASKELKRVDEEIDDYSCLLIKRERVEGELTGRQYIYAKVRHRKLVDDMSSTPFSVYLKFLKPSDVAGREVLYVEGERNGDLLARRGGPRLPNLTVELKPTGRFAMQDNLHPVTEFGFRTLVVKLIENMQRDLLHDDVEVQFFENAKLGDRECQHIQVTQKTERDSAEYHIARIFIDNELRVPVYFASYDWPEAEGDEPPLKEEYIFTNMKINEGFTDRDFQADHPDYAFEEPESHEAVAQTITR